MSKSMDKHRIAYKNDVMYGDSDTTSMATGAASELLKMAGTMAATEQKKKEDAAKKKELDAATAELAAAQKAVNDKPNDNAAKARLADAQAKLASLGGSTSLSVSTGSADHGHAKSEGTPWYWYALGGVAVLGVGVIGYKLLSGGGRRGTRGYMARGGR